MSQKNTNWGALLSFVAYIAVCCIAVSLLLGLIPGGVGTAFKTVANIMAIAITGVVSFGYARSRRNMAYWIVWVVAIVLVAVGLIVGLI